MGNGGIWTGVFDATLARDAIYGGFRYIGLWGVMGVCYNGMGNYHTKQIDKLLTIHHSNCYRHGSGGMEWSGEMVDSEANKYE